MRNPIHVLKSLEEQSKQTDYRYNRLYRNLFNPEFYHLAYRNIATSQGSMTAGTDGRTLDGMSEERIQRIISSLRNHSYQPTPTRREYIPKKNNPRKKRPLGIPATDDKLVQEIVRMLLESIYEPTFSPKSHGFRPKRSCHTALQDIQSHFTGVRWVVEGDIKACFDSFDHHVLINILRRRIEDESFIALMWKFLKAGYMEQWQYHNTYSGTPQGSGISPILANIYLTELDRFIEAYKAKFDSEKKYVRQPTSEYTRARYVCQCAERVLKVKGRTDQDALHAFKAAQKVKLSIHCYDTMDSSYRRIQYNRYADDFVIGVIGSKKDAERIKQELKSFLNDTLKLTLSEEKTKITHSSERVRYLGYDFTVSRSQKTRRTKNGALTRPQYGVVRLYIPHDKWEGKLFEYKAFKLVKDEGKDKTVWKPLHRPKLINWTDIEIISKYNAEIRGLYNFYQLACNVSVLNKFQHIMYNSMCKTYAAKYRTNCTAIRKRFERNGIFTVPYMTKSGMKQCEFYHDGFKMINKASADWMDVLPQYRKYDRINSLSARLRAGVCEICGTKTKDIYMHHIKALKLADRRKTSGMIMLEKQRKSLALCPSCYEKVRLHLL